MTTGENAADVQRSQAPLSYQWRKNGVDISGATDAVYTIIDVQSSQAGSYSVAVSNPGGTVTSSSASLTVTAGSWMQAPSGLAGWWSGNNSLTNLARRNPVQRPFGDSYTSGVVNNGFSMSTSGGYCVVPRTSNLNVGLGGGFTLEAWVKRTTDTAAPLFEWGTSSGTGVHFWGNYVEAGSLYANIRETNGTDHGIGAPNVLPLNKFVHVALTCDVNSGAMRLYVNGDLAGSASGSFQSPLKTDMDFHLGYRPAGGQRFSGVIDEPSVYRRALTAAEVGSLFAVGANGKRPFDLGIDVSQDLLLIYNSNSTYSWTVCQYYLQNRPMVSQANVLPIACNANTSSFTREQFTNEVAIPITNWFNQNPTKRPQYVILFLDIPWRSNTNTPVPLWGYTGTPLDSSVQYLLHESTIPDWHPYVSSINMQDVWSGDNNAYKTDACTGYINKLKDFGNTYSPGQLYISPSRSVSPTYNNGTYVLDNVRFSPYSGFSVTGALLDAGVSPTDINYLDGVETLHAPPYLPHITNAVNVAGYMSWGSQSSLGHQYARVGIDHPYLTWTGNSGWWLIETIESFNGMPFNGHGDYFLWFSADSFGGVNYSNTPVGAVTHTDEPDLPNVNDGSIYFSLWAKGASFSYSAWTSRRTDKFQAVGDPFVCR